MRDENEPIAIVGIGCRFPGGVADPSSLWHKLIQGFDAVAEIPNDRWSTSTFYDAELGRPMKSCSKWAALLPDVDQFDAGFFGISDAEAEVIDPQQRLLLETAWEAMEDAGYVPNPDGERTGVFVGISTHDYEVLQGSILHLNEASPYSSTGLAGSIAANRISYCFNFTGPSFSVDTACSSSLLAVHLACESLRRGECGAALAAGVGCLLGPHNFIAFSSMGVLSPDGRCRAFDAGANGFVRGEGVGAILLRPLRDALASGDPIYATIVATGTNQDGRTRGLALPSRESQEALLRSTCQQAGVSPQDIVYVEAHGTGTAVGDPVEAAALGEVFGSGRDPGQELLIGSIKTNIGHLEAGAGIAGIIKCALCLKHGAAPPNLHFEHPNPAIDFQRWRLKVPTQVEPFPPLPNNGQPAHWLAGVNSFGFGGSNAFALLRSQPERLKHREQGGPPDAHDNGVYLLPISARSEEGLRALAQRYADFLKTAETESHNDLRNLVFSAAHRRRHHEHRLTVAGRSRAELHGRLSAFVQGELPACVSSAEARLRPGPVFVFSGQGAQWPAMARDLYDREPVFRDMMQRCHEALAAQDGSSLLDEFLAGESRSRMDDTVIAQPSIFSLQVSLAALWAHWGIRPAAVVGHSVGEVAAAYVAGVFDLDTAMKVIYHRGNTMKRVSSSGGMLAAALTEDQARALIAPYGRDVCVGAVNSPQSVTLSGDPRVLSEIALQLDSRGCWQRTVPVNYAFHSVQMEPVRAPLLTALVGLSPGHAQIPLYSTVREGLLSGPELDADYWWQNVRQTVRFGPAITHLAQQGYTTFLELSGHPVLSASIRQCLQHSHPDEDWSVLPSLKRGDDGLQVMLSSLGSLHCLGYAVAWNSITPSSASRPVPLPSYAWQHRKHWREAGEHARTRVAETKHPLLMRRVNAPGPSWLSSADTRLLPYLRDHSAQGRPLFPAAGYIELALAVAAEMFPDQPCCLQDVDIESPLFLNEGSPGTRLHIRYEPAGNEFGIFSNIGADEDAWTRHAKGVVRPVRSMASLGVEEIAQIQQRCTTEVEVSAFYRRAEQKGFFYGPMFRTAKRVWHRAGEALCRVELPEALRGDAGRYRLHPAMFDACLQLASILYDETDPQASVGTIFPYAFDRLLFLAPLETCFWGYARVVKQTRSTFVLELKAIADDGRVVALLEGLRYRPVDGPGDADALRNWCYELAWRPKPLPPSQRFLPPSAPADFLPPQPTLAASLQARAEAMRQRMRQPELLRQSGPDVEKLWCLYLFQAFDELGYFPQLGETVSLSTAIERLGVPVASEPLLEWCLGMLAEDGFLRLVSDSRTWRFAVLPDLSQSAASLWRSLLNRFPGLFHELTLLKHYGQSLSRMLMSDREIDAGRLSEEMADLLDQARASAPAWLPSNLILRHAVAEMVKSVPEGRALQVLQLDAGRAALSLHALAELPRETTRYVVADTSPDVLSRAEEQLRDYDGVDCQLLDLSQDPTAQGWELGQFDLLLGVDVFSHSDCRQRLKHALQLLAPGGVLLFSEPDARSRLQSLLWMLLNEFSAREDNNPAARWLPPERSGWLDVLTELGFSEPIVASDTNGVTEFGRAVYVARRPALPDNVPCGSTVADSSASAETRSWLILGDRGGVGRDLAEALRRRSHAVRLAGAEDVGDNMADLVDQECDGIVHLLSLDAPAGETVSLDALRQAQSFVCHSVLHVVQALQRLSGMKPPRLWLVTRNAQPAGQSEAPLSVAQTPLTGLGRVLANEHPEFRCRLVDLAPLAGEADIPALLGELLSDDGEDQVALRGEARYVQRIVPMSTVDGLNRHERGLHRDLPCRLQIGRLGVIDCLRLRPLERRAPAPSEVEIEVCAVGLNFRDVMKVLGIYPGEAEDADLLGDEFAGVVVRVGDSVRERAVGDRVFGMWLGAMATHLTVPSAVALPLPPDITMEDAATIPVASFTAHHALHELARMQPGERILIHSAAGGVGLAAVQLALHAGLEVFGTAGTPAKRQFLRDLGVQHVANSRALDFADEIMALTGGQGVDIVLNSLAGEALIRSLDLLRVGGRFLELGKRDIYGGSTINLRPFRNSLAYFAIDMSRWMSPDRSGPLLAKILPLIEQGVVVPLPHQTFPFADASHAFRRMAQGKHTGKIVLTVDQTPVNRCRGLSAARETLRPDATYLITGGLRGLGLSLAEQCASHGARTLVLTGINGPTSDESQAGLARLRAQGVTVWARSCDAASASDVESLLGEIDRTLPPLRGIVHAATVYDDRVILEMDTAAFERPMHSKAYGAWNLHLQTRKRSLDFFVLLSSVSTVLGNVGQANYAAANAFCDGLAFHRQGLGLPATSIQLDRIRDVGHAARSAELAQHFSRLKWRGIASEQAFEVFQRTLANDITLLLVSSFRWTKTTPGLGPLLTSPRFEFVVREDAGLDDCSGIAGLRQRLSAADPQEQRDMVAQFLRREIADVLRISMIRLPLDRPLKEIGLDSMMAVELMARVESKIGITLTAQQLSGNPTVLTLADAATALLVGLAPAHTAAPATPSGPHR